MALYKFNPVLVDLKYLAPKALDPKRAQMAPNKFNSIPKHFERFLSKKTLDLKSPQMAPFKFNSLPTYILHLFSKTWDLRRTQMTTFQFTLLRNK